MKFDWAAWFEDIGWMVLTGVVAYALLLLL